MPSVVASDLLAIRSTNHRHGGQKRLQLDNDFFVPLSPRLFYSSIFFLGTAGVNGFHGSTGIAFPTHCLSRGKCAFFVRKIAGAMLGPSNSRASGFFVFSNLLFVLIFCSMSLQ